MNDLEKEFEDKQRKRMPVILGVIILLMFVGIVITSALLTSVPADEPEKHAYLVVNEVFFVLSDSENGLSADMVTIDVTAFITNEGTSDAEKVEIVAFTVDQDTNLALDKTSLTVGSISKEKTRSSEFSLTMPNQDLYVIKLIILEDGIIAVRGSGTIKLMGDTQSKGGDFRTDPRGGGGAMSDGDGLASSFAEESPLGIILVACVILIIILIARLVPSASKKPIKSTIPPQMNNGLEHNTNNLPLYQDQNVVDAIPLQSDDKTYSGPDKNRFFESGKHSPSVDTEQAKGKEDTL